MREFRDKVAVITGAGSGIGRALAIRLAADGARLALSDVDEPAMAGTMKLVGLNGLARAYRLDVSCREAVFEHAERVKADFGTAHLLFNNAGTTLFGTFENQTIEEVRRLLDVNLWGVIYGTKAFLPMMLAQREGCIVTLSSVFGLVGFPTHSAYNISKFGVRGLMECLWSELEGTGVEAICVHPGGIDTGFETRSWMAAAAGPRERTMKSKAATLMVTTPADCASAILEGIRRGKRRIVTGQHAKLLYWLPRLLPASYPRFLRRFAV
jgi:NAD(P)-dependent dehydrogenase (short-subunit alcohol dehydrogenase family)